MYQILSTCKGGGYMYCRTYPQHPKQNAKGLYPLHRVLAENKIGRALESNEVVHHSDHNKDNNSIENLEVISVEYHARIHVKKVERVEMICPNCNRPFFIRQRLADLRAKRNKTNAVFCSRSCGSTMPHKLKRMECSV